MGGKVGDRISLAILGLLSGGTFIALALTSVAKKAGQTGKPEKPDWPWLKTAEASFEDRLRQMDALPSQQRPGGPGGGEQAGGNGSGGSGSAAPS